VQRVVSLFRDDRELILGFGTFLPRGRAGVT
jgi:histone deacetylase complex regulatory component SIN3